MENRIREEGECFFNPKGVSRRYLGKMEGACDECPWLSDCLEDNQKGGN